MSDAERVTELRSLLAKVRGYRMSPDERERQIVSMAYGNLRVEDDRVTRAAVMRAAAATVKR